MNNLIFWRRRAVLAGWLVVGITSNLAAQTAVNVTEHHNHKSRDGLYVDPAFTQAAAAGLKRDLAFSGTISGNVYAQPLYLEGGPGGRAMIVAVTESNNVYALDAASGAVIWQRHVGTPVSSSSLPCGDINPLGITGTPVIDLPSRTLVFDAMTTPNNGVTKKHLIFALNVDTGTTNSGWPVDVNATATFGTNVFSSTTQNQRSALGLVDGTVYVTYGGHAGDCGVYYGWIVGVPLSNPSSVMAWATTARGGGAWSVGGVASDGITPFIATGNTFGASGWGGGEAIIRFQPGPSFSTLTNDYWTPANWASLDSADADIGGSGPVLVDVPGATPSALVVALGKDGNAYLLNRTNLGGITAPLAQAHVSSSSIIQAAATYRTAQGAYVVFCGNTSQNQLTALRIGASNPPSITNVWTRTQNGRGSPFVTSTDGTNNVIVWGLGAENDQRLHGFDGDTGNIVFAGGGASELMAGTRRFSTAIAARGRIYVAADNKVYAFTVPVAPIILTNLAFGPGGGAFQLGFSNVPGMSFTVFGTTNVALPTANWTRLGGVTETSPGQFQFTDVQAANNDQRFYRVRSP
jgi:outer membrane protein assembly factor BamB